VENKVLWLFMQTGFYENIICLNKVWKQDISQVVMQTSCLKRWLVSWTLLSLPQTLFFARLAAVLPSITITCDRVPK
jgi:hypothetical protein